MTTSELNCNCEYCKNKLPFDLPVEIIEAMNAGRLIVFAGAGISTENKNVFNETFYDDIYNDLNLEKDTDIDFPSLMSLYCNQPNGRRLLLSKIKERFDYAEKFHELYKVASWFHNELSSIYQIDKIVTTNWDDYFEKECAAIPIVSAEDFAFYNVPERKVFKIHGSISNYGSIVATNKDYRKCYKKLRTGLIGANLKSLLATNVVIFFGFSFRDYDFNRIYDYLSKEMGDVIPHIYVVSIDIGLSKKFDNKKVTFIQTDAKYFISTLRKHLEGSGALLRKENIDNLFEIREILISNKEISIDHFHKNKFPTHIYNLFYQDGVRHALDNLYFYSKSGKSFNPIFVISTVDSYEKIRTELIAKKRYGTLAYVEGYLYTFKAYLVNTKPNQFNYFYIIGLDFVDSFKEYKKLTRGNNSYHKTAEKQGLKKFKEFLDNDFNEVPKHRPFIW